MNINADIDKPIFQQIREGIEDAIILGAFPEGSQIPSITEISVNYKINPATALKGVNLLVEENIVYKKRGVGMFVCDGAVDRLMENRRKEFYDKYVSSLISEAKKLKLSEQDIKQMIERGFGSEY
ncbi:GntR family transcriptional regulator [bacterium]|nr:GntR family transcriptional regulator [bacterium]MDY3861360.1 GntR family transcriptional regulator [Ruminococcus sp.]